MFVQLPKLRALLGWESADCRMVADDGFVQNMNRFFKWRMSQIQAFVTLISNHVIEKFSLFSANRQLWLFTEFTELSVSPCES